MNLRELFEAGFSVLSAPEQEQIDAQQQADKSVAQQSDTRRTRLTLDQINRLRILQDAKTAEYNQKVKMIKKQYGSGEKSEEGGL